MNRAFGAIITLLWLGFMAALVQRDVLPYWFAQEPPKQLVAQGEFQVAIRNGDRQIGTTWVIARSMQRLATVQSTTLLNVHALSGIPLFSGEIGTETDLSYDESGQLSNFIFSIYGAGVPIRVSGERYAGDYAITAKLGAMTQFMSFDGQASRSLGDSLRPFTHLHGLTIGQTWRIRFLDPISLLKGETPEFEMRLVKVTARENIKHGGKDVLCYRVETDGTTAWADDTGRVLRQEVNIPLLGKWTMTDEKFDKAAYEDAKRRLKAMRSGG